MKILVCSPVSLKLFETKLGQAMPDGYRYPQAAYYVLSLLDEGHEVVVLTNTHDVDFITKWKQGPLTVIATPRRRPRAFCPDFYRSERKAMLDIIPGENPDIVHAHWTYEFAAVAIASGCPYVVTARDFPPAIFLYTRQLYRLFRLAYSAFIVPRCKNLVTISPYLEEKFSGLYFKRSRAVIPNGLPSTVIVDQSPERQRNGKFVVAVVANWDRRKNVSTAIDAFYLVKQRFPALEIHLFGDGLGRNEGAHQYAINRGDESGLHFHGYQDSGTMREFHLKHTDLLLHPSLEESFGMTVLEAMALGIPVIGGKDSGAVAWVIGNGGAVVDVSKPELIADQLLEFILNPRYLEDAGRRALERVKLKFSMKSVVHQYTELFEDVIRESR